MKKVLAVLDHPFLLILFGLLLTFFVMFLAGKTEYLGESVHGPSIFYGIVLCWSGEMLGAGITRFFDSKSSALADDNK